MTKQVFTLAFLAVFLSFSHALADMTKNVTTDDQCYLNVDWTWNPANIGDTGSHSSANWEVTIGVINDPTKGPLIVVNALHKPRRCHDIDRRADIWEMQMALPAVPADGERSGIVRHRTTGRDHSDTYGFEYHLRADASKNQFIVWGSHDDKPVPPRKDREPGRIRR